jgi:alpha-glucosidase
MKLIKIFCLGLLVAGIAHGAPENIGEDASSVSLHLDRADIALVAVDTNIFRLSISFNGPPRPAASTFLDPSNLNPSLPWSKIKEHGMIGLQTTAGRLLLNPKNGEWTLEDAAGKTLIPRHQVGDFNTSTNNSSIQIALGWPAHKPIAVYGSGNGTNALRQQTATTGLGNGVAVIPYYWSPAGYAILAVSADDNRPASWEAAKNHRSITWTFPGDRADLYLMPATTLKDAAASYARLTGHAPIPPLWAFGYLQSRWGWADRAYIENALKKFNDLKIPVDAFIYDFEWYTHEPDYALPPQGLPDFQDFSWNTNLFSDPSAQIKNYQDQGVHFVGIRKPRLGNADVLAMARAKGWTAFGSDDNNHVTAREVKFENPDFREWYIQHSAPLLRDGVDGWWNDEGESRFTLYYYWNSAEKEAFNEYEPGKRLWTLNRAFSPGLQRLGAAAWTGDIRSTWKAFADTPPSLLNWSLAGMPYEACDIGGFSGTPTPELLSRWIEAGVFFPVMRTHSSIDVRPHFPWMFGPDALQAIRKAIDLRYRLIPYYYSLAYETFTTGLPLMRPLVMEFPGDPKAANLSDEWMMGPSLLAAPVLTPGDKRSVYLPDDHWYRFETSTPIKGKQSIQVTAALDEIPLYVRAGTILPLAPPVLHTSEFPGGALELQIYGGKDAMFTLVEDDGATTAYLDGQIRRTIFQWHDATKRLSWTVDGNYAGKNIFKNFHVTVFDPQGVLHAQGSLGNGGSLGFQP